LGLDRVRCVVGLESALPIVLTSLIEPGHASWAEVETLLSQKPAEIGRLAVGAEGQHPSKLDAGQPADLVLVDPTGTSVFDLDRLHGQSQNSPFLGMELPGRVTHTIRRGYLTLDSGELVAAERVAAAAHQNGATA
ncbi:MAG: dihydroorotase, partial [Leucobacter sp.]|nr:dihydroorotase [Leucobacter sp.]